jgi:hypothetical protein
MAESPKVLGENELTITLPPFSENTLIASFPVDTTVSFTLYIQNTTDIPYGTSDKVELTIVDWLYSQQSEFSLDSYNYGKYIENYPVQYIYMQNNMPTTMQIYFQYIIKQYYQYSLPVIEDLTQLQTQNIYITEGLIGGNNFKFAGPISSLNMANFPIGTTFYLLDAQIYSTTSASTGSVTVKWNSTSTFVYQVAALGVNEMATLWTFTVDSTTQGIPGNTTSSDAALNWVVIEYFSPLNITYTTQTFPLIYNSATNTFQVASNSSLLVNANSSYLNTVPAPFTQFAITS